MRRFSGIFGLVIILGIIFQAGLTSCTKTNTVTKTITDTVTVTVVQTDTIVKKDTALTVDILTANSWKVQEVRALLGNNTTVFYLRGGSANTISFDNEYVTFHSDHTGTYVDNLGTSSTLTWNFTDATNTTLVWTWNLSPAVVVTWEHVYYKNAALHYDEYYNQSGLNLLTSEIRIPK